MGGLYFFTFYCYEYHHAGNYVFFKIASATKCFKKAFLFEQIQVNSLSLNKKEKLRPDLDF